MRSEAQTRWEKGVDPEARAGRCDATPRSCLVELAGARWTGETEVRGEIRRRRRGSRIGPATRRGARPRRSPEDDQRERLRRLGFTVDDDWTVTRPSWRARDVRRDIDVVEEVARFRLEDVPATLPRAAGDVRPAARTRSGCAARSRTCSSAPGCTRRTRTRCSRTIPTRTRSSCRCRCRSQQRLLRTTLHGRPARRRASQRRHGQRTTLELFEVAHVYLPAAARCPTERWRLGGIVAGRLLPREGDRRGGLRGAARRAGVRACATCSTDFAVGARGAVRLGGAPTARSTSTASGARSSSTSRSSSRSCRSGSSTAT